MAGSPPRMIAGPLAGMKWSLESPEEHRAEHDRAQVRYWLSRTPAERLAQAAHYRTRVFGDGPYVLKPILTWLPPLVPGE